MSTWSFRIKKKAFSNFSYIFFSDPASVTFGFCFFFQKEFKKNETWFYKKKKSEHWRFLLLQRLIEIKLGNFQHCLHIFRLALLWSLQFCEFLGWENHCKQCLIWMWNDNINTIWQKKKQNKIFQTYMWEFFGFSENLFQFFGERSHYFKDFPFFTNFQISKLSEPWEQKKS